MEYLITKTEVQVNNEDGLSSVFFQYNNGYFSLSKTEEDDSFYIEKDDQAFGEYVTANDVYYSYNGTNRIRLKLTDALAKQIKAVPDIVLILNNIDEKCQIEIANALLTIFGKKVRCL